MRAQVRDWVLFVVPATMNPNRAGAAIPALVLRTTYDEDDETEQADLLVFVDGIGPHEVHAVEHDEQQLAPGTWHHGDALRAALLELADKVEQQGFFASRDLSELQQQMAALTRRVEELAAANVCTE